MVHSSRLRKATWIEHESRYGPTAPPTPWAAWLKNSHKTAEMSGFLTSLLVQFDGDSPANFTASLLVSGGGLWFERFGAGENPGPARKP
jgi:hypothetical protein